MKKIFKLLICVLLIALTLCTPFVAFAKSTNTYSYSGEEPKLSPDACIVEKSIYGKDIGCGDLKSPQDLCIFGDEIYITDSGNNRIVVTDLSFKFKREIKSFIKDGQETLLSEPKGMFINDDCLCVTDTGNARVLVIDNSGNVVLTLEKPNSELYNQKLEFKPQKVLKDKNGFYYVINFGNYEGALLYNPDGSFNSFFGGNKVTVTVTLLVENFWRNIMNKTQISKTVQNIPQEYGNFDIDSKGFIYTCTNNTTDKVDQIKKLNPNGENVWDSGKNYGDTAEIYDGKNELVTRIVDLSIDENDFITAVDSQFGHIFQYSAVDGRILFALGNIGAQSGTFATPAAIETDNDFIYVLDSSKANITVYKYTQYGKDVRTAMTLFNDGKYQDALDYWKTVIRKNGNLQIAYIGIGEALLGQKKYTEAMEYFEIGRYKEGYSEAFLLYRKDLLQDNFTWILIFVVGLLITVYTVSYINKKNKKVDFTIKRYKKWQYPFYVCFHPAKGYEDLKWSNQTSFVASIIILALWFVSSILKRQNTAFLFNTNLDTLVEFNILVQFLSTVGLFAAFVVINWALCTLFEGKGTMKNIWIYTSYALIPVVISNYLWVGLSYVFGADEAAFLNIINAACLIWALALLLKGMSVLHEYNLKQVILSLLATVFGMAIVVFLLVLVISLFNRLLTFFTTIIDEIRMHSVMKGG